MTHAIEVSPVNESTVAASHKNTAAASDLPTTTVERIREHIFAEWLELDTSLQQVLAKEMQDLISRGLSNSTVVISTLKEACNRNLMTRCEIAVDSIRKVLHAHKIQSTATTSSNLQLLFRDVYAIGHKTVADTFEKAIPNLDKASLGNYVEIRYEGIRVDKYLAEIALISDQLFPASPSVAGEKSSSALATWKEKLDFLRQQEAITADPSQKFELKQRIEEAVQKIRELGGTA